MPKVTILFNDSPDCVVIHHGVRPLRRRDRIELMRPFAEVVIVTLAGMFPHIQFEARPRPLEQGPACLLWAEIPDGVTPEDKQGILAVTNGVKSDLTLAIDSYPSVVELLSPSDLEVMRRMSRMALPDRASIIGALDEALLTLHGVMPLGGVDILIHLHGHPDAGGGEVIPATAGDDLVGFLIEVIVPATLGIVVHEVAHVLECMLGEIDATEHREAYVAHLSRVLQLMVSSGCEERIRSTSAVTHDAKGNAAVIDGGRWRLSTGDGEAYAIWRPDDAAVWGRDWGGRGLFHLIEAHQREFVVSALGGPP